MIHYDGKGTAHKKKYGYKMINAPCAPNGKVTMKKIYI